MVLVQHEFGLYAAQEEDVYKRQGLYGVDLKMVDDKAYVIEINDNPSIDHGLEDAIIGDEMYYRLLNHFEQALETKHY